MPEHESQELTPQHTRPAREHLFSGAPREAAPSSAERRDEALREPPTTSEVPARIRSPETISAETPVTEDRPHGGRPMQVRRFLMGTLIAATGVAIMLVVAFGLLQGWGVDERLSLPLIAICMIVGLMLLGGGFGVMATSAGTFDDDEFERLMAGERRRFDEEGKATLPPPQRLPDAPEDTPARHGRADTTVSLRC